MFVTEGEAKRLLVEKIVARAAAEGNPLSSAQRWMLSFSESDPEVAVDPDLVARCEAEISADEYEAKVTGLLQRSYEHDLTSGSVARDLYREAHAKLAEGDHYLLVMVAAALGPPRAAWRAVSTGPIAALRSLGWFALLALPGTLGLLLAAVLAWGLIWERTFSAPQTMVVALVAMVLAAGGAYLIRLWHRERRM